MVSRDQVDICVTCVSDKPPKLPLREELVSLGVEVVLNAQGVGAKAVKHETRRKVKEFREKFEARSRSSVICFPWKSHKQKIQEKRERKRAEKELKKRQHGLSYAKYSKILNGQESSIFGSDSSWNTNSTGSSSEVSEKNGAVRRATFLHRRNERGSRPDHVSDAAVASAFAGSNAADLLKESKISKEELPTAIEFKPRRDKAKYDHSEDDSVLDAEQEEATPGLSAYSFLSANDSVQASYSRRASSDMFMYEKWDMAASGELSDGNSSDGSLYTSSADGDKKSESPSLEGKNKLLAITNDDITPENEKRKGTELESILGIPEVTSPRAEPLLFEAAGTRNENDRASPPFKQFIHDSEDEDSFMLDDSSVSIGLPSMEEASTTSEMPSVLSRKRTQHITLLAALTQGCASQTSELPNLVNCDVNLAPQPGATSPLHDACAEDFPDRLSSPDTSILDVVNQLTQDITSRMERLHFITSYLPHACMMENRDGDLPVHILVRRLIEWEASWQEQLKLADVEDWTDAAKFTQLHKLMGVCVDLVLNPMVRNRLACRSRGKLGTRILPLHAAAMFAVPYDTMQALIESYPEATNVASDLGYLKTYIVNELLPLELLERKRSDFVSSSSGIPLAKPSGDEPDVLLSVSDEGDDDGIKWTKSTLCSNNIADDLIRRSDLLFAFNPILPYRKDAARMKRIELTIRAEAQVAMARREKTLDPTARAAWTWVCTFEEPTGEQDTYVDTVGRIISALDTTTVNFLANLDTPEGTILETAQPDCAHIIQSKLDGKPVEQYTRSASFSPRRSDQNDSVKKSILKSAKTENEISYIVGGTICRNALCREVFNIRERAIPTNYVLLPYELARNEDGSLGLGTPESAPIAVQFAACLTDLTQPWHVNHILEKKAMACLGHTLTGKRATGFQTFDWRSKIMVKQLISLFKGKGYLYLLDEDTGGPIVPEASESYPISPITLEKPAEAIENLLPILLMGMIRMRGDRSIIIIIETMIAGKRAPPENWITVMQNIVRHLYTRGSTLSTDARERKELLALSEALSDFVARTTKRNTTRRPESEDGVEWTTELSYLKAILEGTALLAAAKLPSAKFGLSSSTNRPSSVKAEVETISSDALILASNSEQNDDPLSQGSNDDFDKIWAPADDGSVQGKKDQNAKLVEIDNSTQSEQDYRANTDAFSSSSDDDSLSESERKNMPDAEVFTGSDIDQECSQVDIQQTAIVKRNETLTRPPRAPNTPNRLTEDQEEKLKAIKHRLKDVDSMLVKYDQSRIEVQENTKKETLARRLNGDDTDVESSLDDQDSRDDYSSELISRLLGLEERIHDREDEMEELRHHVCSFERKAADAIYEALSRDEDIDSSFVSSSKEGDTSFTSAEEISFSPSTTKKGTIVVPCDSSDETSQSSSTFSQVSTYSTITSMASSIPKRKATFTFEGASSSYVSSSSDEETSRSSSDATSEKSESPSSTDENTSYDSSSTDKSNSIVCSTTAGGSSYFSSSVDHARSESAPELMKEDPQLDDRDLLTEVFSSDELDMLLKSFSVDDTPDVPGNPFSGDEKDSSISDVPGNPFSGDEEDSSSNPLDAEAPDSPNNPFSSSNAGSKAPDGPGNPFSPTSAADLHLVISSRGKAMIEI